MCVIIHGLRKKHLTQEEIVNAMKKNSSGFWMAHWAPDCKKKEGRETIRTLREDDALKFFNETPEDHVFVMHARIPSKGGVSLDNVHGWEDHGILFAHNMTISSLSDLMSAEKWEGTDSEYFFRKLFIPMHIGEHMQNPDLPESEMGPATKRLVSAICGTSNKFLFVMPNNTVIRAGHWETIVTEKRTCMEEREYDIVVSEKVNDKGAVEKITEKVKRKIPVEREFAVAVASNTYYRPSTYSCRTSYSGYHSSYYQGTGTGTANRTGYRQGSLYDSDEGEWEGWYRGLRCNGGTGAGTGGDDAKKTRIKKSDIEAANVEQFMKWRTSLPVKNEITVIDDKFFEDSPLFGGVKTERGMIDSDSFKDVFNIILRAFVYVNMQRNNSEIVRMMDGYGTSVSFEDERLQLLDKLFEECPLDKDFLANVVTKLYDISKSLTPDPTTSKFILPSEAVMSAFRDLMGDLDAFAYQFMEEEYGQEFSSLEEYNVFVGENFRDKLNAIDSSINLSFDPKVKANKDVEKYVKAAFVDSRKLRWIPAPLLIAPTKSMVSTYGTWIESKQKEDLLRALNILAEAAVTNGESLANEDKKYIASLKELGYDFEKLGSTEIFIPGQLEEDNKDKTDAKDSSVDLAAGAKESKDGGSAGSSEGGVNAAAEALEKDHDDANAEESVKAGGSSGSNAPKDGKDDKR